MIIDYNLVSVKTVEKEAKQKQDEQNHIVSAQNTVKNEEERLQRGDISEHDISIFIANMSDRYAIGLSAVLGFYSDGTVIFTSHQFESFSKSKGVGYDIAQWFNKNHQTIAKGRYFTKGNGISYSFTTNDSAIHYGKIVEGRRLLLETKNANTVSSKKGDYLFAGKINAELKIFTEEKHIPTKAIFPQKKIPVHEQSRKWTQQGLCMFCGGKIGILTKKCKVCGNQN